MVEAKCEGSGTCQHMCWRCQKAVFQEEILVALDQQTAPPPLAPNLRNKRLGRTAITIGSLSIHSRAMYSMASLLTA